MRLRAAVACAVPCGITVALSALAPLPAGAATPPLSGKTVQALAWFGGAAYAGTDQGLYRLGASGWTAASSVPSTVSVQALAVVGSTLLAGTDNGAIRSGDGSVWASAGLSGQNVISFAVSGGTVLAGTGHDGGSDGAALRSDDAGQTWSPATTLPAAMGLPGAPVQAVLPPASGQPALAGTAGSGVLHSASGSGGWSDDSAGLSSRWITALWRDPAAPGSVLAGTDDGLDQSSGGAWSLASFPQQDPWIQALATATGGGPLAGTYDGGVYQRSGGRWSTLASGLPSVLSLVAVPQAQGGGVLAGTFDGAYCIGCSSSLSPAGAPPASARPGATPLPPVAARPGASGKAGTASGSPSAGGSAGATPGGASAGAGALGTAGAGGSGGGTGVPHLVWYIAAALVALSGALTAWGVRRSRREDAPEK